MPDPCISPDNQTLVLDTDDLGRLTGEVRRDASAYNGLSVTPGGLFAPAVASKETSLPQNPYDGQRIRYYANGLADRHWSFTWNAVAGLWEFDGGSPLFQIVFANETRPGAVGGSGYNDLATVGPQVTVPLAGTYFFRFGCRLAMAGAAGAAIMSLRYGTANPVDTDGVLSSIYVAAGSMNTGSRTLRKAGIQANTFVTGKYTSTGTDSAIFEQRWLEVWPESVHL